jgi:hypothetical protein
VSEKEQEIDTLKRLAGRYIWWKMPDEAAAMPARVIAQVMNLGDYDDVQILVKHVGDAALRDARLQRRLPQRVEGVAHDGIEPAVYFFPGPEVARQVI